VYEINSSRNSFAQEAIIQHWKFLAHNAIMANEESKLTRRSKRYHVAVKQMACAK